MQFTKEPSAPHLVGGPYNFYSEITRYFFVEDVTVVDNLTGEPVTINDGALVLTGGTTMDNASNTDIQLTFVSSTNNANTANGEIMNSSFTINIVCMR